MALSHPKPLRWLALAAPAGFCLALLALYAPRRTYTDCLPRQECSAIVRGLITQPHYVDGELEWMRPAAGAVLRLLAVKTRDRNQWLSCRGRVLYRGPSAGSLPYGTEVEIDGMFLTPPDSVVPGSFSYRRYLQARGIVHLLEGRELKVRSDGSHADALGALLRFRDHCARLLARGFTSESNAAVLLAMCFGYKHSLDPELRLRFLESGAVHIFAISGLHVGIVAGLLNLLLRSLGLGLRKRRIVLPVGALLYVAMTGAAPSAVRAWLMLTLWCASELRYEAPSRINSIALAAVVLLVINPLNLVQTGFVFSFTIVSVLVQGWGVVRKAVALAFEKQKWLPPSSRRHGMGRGVWAKSLRVALGASLAWLGSAGLIASVNALIIPSALIVNILLSSAAFVVIGLALPKLVVSALGIGWLETGIVSLVEWLLEAVRLAVTVGGTQGSFGVPRPHPAFAVLYYAALAAGLTPRLPNRIRAAFFAVPLLGLVLLSASARLRPPRVAVLDSGGNMPALLLDVGGTVPPVLVNTGGVAERSVVAWLEANGIRKLDMLCVTSSAWGETGGWKELMRRLDVALVARPEGVEAGAAAEIAEAQAGTGGRICEMTRISVPSGVAYEAAASGVLIHVVREQGVCRRIEVRRRAKLDDFGLVYEAHANGGYVVSSTRNGRLCATRQFSRQATPRMSILRLSHCLTSNSAKID